MGNALGRPPARAALTESDINDGIIKSSHIADDTVVAADIADDAVGIAKLSATGTASSSTYLRGDNSWAEAGSPSITDNGNANAMTIAADETITHVEMSTFSKIWQNPNTISANITIASGYSAAAAGPINFTGTLAINGNLSII